eukprot:scaffold91265_cov65-Phaeocystis_antarctica.AAC.2
MFLLALHDNSCTCLKNCRTRASRQRGASRTSFATRHGSAMFVLALPGLAALAAAPSTFELVGHPKECNCLDAKNPDRQLRLETYLAATPNAPLLQANHDKGERFQAQPFKRRAHSNTYAKPVYVHSQSLDAEHGGTLRQRAGRACAAAGRRLSLHVRPGASVLAAAAPRYVHRTRTSLGRADVPRTVAPQAGAEASHADVSGWHMPLHHVTHCKGCSEEVALRIVQMLVDAGAEPGLARDKKGTATDWRSGGCLQRQIMPQAVPNFGQPRPISRLGRAGRPYRACFDTGHCDQGSHSAWVDVRREAAASEASHTVSSGQTVDTATIVNRSR